MEVLNDNSLMPWGRYIGKRMANVPAPYLLWLLKQGCKDPRVKRYIVTNMDVLILENEKIQSYASNKRH